MKTLISFVIPVYNVSAYLKRCLDSCSFFLDGTNEMIIVNDGSTDHSQEIAEQYAQTHNNVYIYTQENKGLSAARNTGLRYAKGEFVWFIDSDDYIDYLEFRKILSILSSDVKYDIVVFGRIDEFDNQIKKNCGLSDKEYNSGVDFFNQALKKDFYRTNAWDKLFRREFLLKNKLLFIEGKLYEDMLFCFEAYIYASYVRLCNIFPYHYILYNDGSITKQIRKKDLDVLWFVDRADDLFTQKGVLNGITKKAYYQMIFNWVNSCLIKKYAPLIPKYGEAKELCESVFLNSVFKKSIQYCISHKVLFRQWIMAVFLFFTPRLYCSIVRILHKKN